MILEIDDPKAEDAILKLASLRGTTASKVVVAACEEALARDRRKSLEERLAEVHDMVRAMPETGEKADKAFFNELWGEADDFGHDK